MSVPARHSHALALLGQEGFERIATAKILVVGAGGIGCELLKNLVLFGFKDIEVIDLDTIDLSNLNRQFLFNKSHIKKSKALIASSTAVSFCPSARITPHHADILKGGPSGAGYKEGARFGADYYAKFDVVLNALDNLEARRHVNKMCVATGTPLVESGTAGFIGQVQPILKGTTECYDCIPKETPKSFPVCTIRSTPSTPIHCIVWAKSWLFNQLFGADDETEDQELDKALAEGENADEISNLRAEAREMSELRQSLLDTTTSARDSADRVFTKIFKGDVERLLSMEDMWKSRRKPVPLVFDEAIAAAADGESNGAAASGLKDQRTLSLKETVELFETSLAALSARLASNPADPLSFDKDDTDALDFVTAVANLRARVYHIPTLTRFQVKQMAGNIIPAIASTNAIIAGALVLQAVHALNGNWSAARLVNKTGMPRFLVGSKTSAPNPACGVCSEVYVTLKADPAKVTIGDVVKAAKLSREEGGLGMETDDVEVYDNKRLLADSDFEDNLGKTLAEFEIGVGGVISLVDEDGAKATINMLIEKLPTPQAGEAEQKSWQLPPVDKLPALLDRAKIPTPPPDSDEEDDVAVVDAPTEPKVAKVSRKRPADEELPNPKRRQGEMSGADAESAIEL